MGCSSTQVERTPLRLGPADIHGCLRRLHLEHSPNAPIGNKLPPPSPNDIAHVIAHRAAVRDLGETADLREQRPMVRAPALRSETRYGTPDLLLWCDDGYLPVLAVAHRTTSPGQGARCSSVTAPTDMRLDPHRKARSHSRDLARLAHLWVLLDELGLAASRRAGAVLGRGSNRDETLGDDATVLVWHDLTEQIADYLLDFEIRQAVATAARDNEELVRPSRVGACRRCPWWPVCATELTEQGDISLIAAGEDVTVLRAAGAETLTDLIELPTDQVAALPLHGIPAAEAQVRAVAVRAGWLALRRRPLVEVPRADVELDVDMESFLDAGAYLWGTLLSGADIGYLRTYRPLVTWADIPGPAEASVFAQFWDYLRQLRAAAAAGGLTFTAYCWSRAAEERWMRDVPVRYAEHPGVPELAEVEDFCASEQWVDLYAVTKRELLVPGSLRLKAIAALANFTWRDPEPGGLNSLNWYRDAIAGDGRMRTRLLQYNEDDVRATYALRRFMSEQADSLPTVAEVADSCGRFGDRPNRV